VKREEIHQKRTYLGCVTETKIEAYLSVLASATLHQHEVMDGCYLLVGEVVVG
jgi:hypothetical protein